MVNSKLIQFLSVLTSREIQKLYEYIQSPFFYKNQETVLLFEYFKPYLKNLNCPELDKKIVFAHIFKGKEYDNIKFNHFCHEAMEMCENFYQHLYLDKHDIPSHKRLFDMYLNQGLSKHFEALQKSLSHALEKKQIRNTEYYYNAWLNDVYAAQLTFSTYNRDKDNRSHHQVKNLDFFYIARKLEYLCASLNQQHILQASPPLTLENEILLYIQQSNILADSPIIKMLYHSFLMLKGIEDEENFHLLFSLLPQYANMLHVVEKKNFYSFLQNYCISKINKGETEKYEALLLQLYKSQIESQSLFDNKGKILVGNFKNIITIAVRIKDLTWAKHFLENYAIYLPDEVRGDVEGYCSAKIAFALADYSSVIKQLYQVEPADIYFNLDARKLLVQAYFELSEWESTLVTLNAFKIFVHRDTTISEKHKEANRNFVNILTKLIRFTLNSPQKIPKIKEELHNTANVAERKWLSDKINLSSMLGDLSTSKG